MMMMMIMMLMMMVMMMTMTRKGGDQTGRSGTSSIAMTSVIIVAKSASVIVSSRNWVSITVWKREMLYK